MSYLEEHINTIILGDCLDIMRQMPDKCIDLVLTDPPYGDGIGYGRNGKTILGNENPDINKHIMPDVFRLLKDNSTFFCFTNWKFQHLVREYAESVGFTTRHLLVVVKNNIGMGNIFRNQYELCWVFEKGKPNYAGQTSNVLNMENIFHDKTTHPHQKGIKLLSKLVKLTRGGVVLDCFSGSGTTAIACHNLKRNFICIEKDKEYYEASVKRLEDHKKQLNLF